MSSEQVRAARALLRWEQRQLAEASGVSLPSIKRLETSPGPLAAQERTVAAIRTALEAAGVIFVEENGEGPGVRLKRQRASTMDKINVGDYVKLREDRPGPAPQHIGEIGRVVDPGRPPPFASHIWVSFSGEPECAYDKGAFIKVKPPSAA